MNQLLSLIVKKPIYALSLCNVHLIMDDPEGQSDKYNILGNIKNLLIDLLIDASGNILLAKFGVVPSTIM